MLLSYMPWSLKRFFPCPKRRYDYNHDIILVKFVMYSYRGSRNHLYFIWKIHESETEGELLKKNMNIAQELRKTIPTYNTCDM